MIRYVLNGDISISQAMKIIDHFSQYHWRTEEKTRQAINSALGNVAAYESETNELIGFILAGTPDQAYFIYIHSLMVIPDYQRQKIGKELMTRLLNYCRTLDYMDTVCFAAPGAKEFLESVGFVKDLDNIQGMILKK